MKGDSNSDLKNNVSSYRLTALSTLSTSNPTTNKTSESNCRSSSLTSTFKSNKKQLNKLIDLDSASESTDYVTGDSKSLSDKNDLEILIENASTSSDTCSKSSNKTFSLDRSNSSNSTSSHSTRTLTKNISESLSESVSESISNKSLPSQQSSTRQLISTSTSLYTTADDCSCDCKSDSSATLNDNLNEVICCSRSSCLVSNCTCCLTHPNYSIKFKTNDKLIELDETECLENSSLDSSESYDESTTTSFRTHSKSLNQVNSDDQSTYNQEHTYTVTEDDLQKDKSNLIRLNELIELTNKSDYSNSSKNSNQINQIKIETNLIDFKNSHCDNQASCATNTLSELINYEQLTSNTTNSSQTANEQLNHNQLDRSPTDQISDTNSSPLNDEETSSLSQLTKSIRASNVSTLEQQTATLKPYNSSSFHQLTDKQLIELADSNLKSSLKQFQMQKLNTDSAKLITMNLDDDDLTEEEDDDVEKIKPNQLHLNTLSDISMLTFPEVEENVDTYKQHNSSRCLLNCSPNKCSSKNHNDLIDDTSTFNDLNLMKDLSDLNSVNTQSTAQIDDDQLMKYNDPTLNPGDHSSELDSDLDAEFDQEDDELVRLDHDPDIELLISNNLTTDTCDNYEDCDSDSEKDDLNNLDNEMKDEKKVEHNQRRLIELNKLSTDDFVIINNTNFDKFDGSFKEEASIVLKNKSQSNTTVSNTCLAKKSDLNGSNSSLNGKPTNGQLKESINTNGTTNGKLNGKVNGVDSKQQTNGHAPKIDSVKVDTSKAQKKFSQDLNEEGNCGICDKTVFQVEKIKAEKRVYHKNCFRCMDCRKQLSMDSYNSHKGQLYCQVHFKLLLRPKPVECIGDDYLSRRQRKMIIRESTPTETPPGIIRSDSKIDDGLDNIQLDLTNLRQRFENGNSQSSEENSRPNSKAERNQLQRSESILKKVQRYQSIASGKKMANSDSESASNSGHNSDVETDLVKEDLTHKEKVNFNGLSAIKTQFENGSLKNSSSSNDDVSPSGINGGHDDEVKNELFKLRQRMCLGRSSSMKQAYENQVNNQINGNGKSNNDESSTADEIDGDIKNDSGSNEEVKNELFKLRQKMCLGRSSSMKQVYENQVINQVNGSSKSNSSQTNSLERPRINTNSMKEKFEKGEFTTENELEFKEKLRREVDEELNIVHESETAAKDAKIKFKELEKSNSFQQQNNLLNNLRSQNNTPRSTPTHHPKVTTAKKDDDKPIEIVKCSEPGLKEEVNINVVDLQERYRFFEQANNQNEENQKPQITETPRRKIELPKALDDCVVETPNEQIKRDPNVIRSSDVIDDLPKNDIAKKMLNVFQQLEKSSTTPVPKELNGAQQRQRPPKRCITPPKDYTVDNSNEDETDAPIVNGHNQDIVRSSYKDDSVIPVEPEKAKSLKAKFENWAQFSNEVENENRKNSSLTESIEEIPQNDITKNLRSKFESFREDKNEENRVSKMKVNRFVPNFNKLMDLCSICDKPVYFVDKLELKCDFKVHRKCFRCCHCSSLLRLQNYTYSVGKLYCLAHFKQLFLIKGNYHESFGEQQKWKKMTETTKSRTSSGSSRNDSPDQEEEFLEEFN